MKDGGKSFRYTRRNGDWVQEEEGRERMTEREREEEGERERGQGRGGGRDWRNEMKREKIFPGRAFADSPALGENTPSQNRRAEIQTQSCFHEFV